MYRKVLYILLIVQQTESYKVDVIVKEGRIIGTTGVTVFDGKLYYAFYGIPYALPPTGNLRFKDPEPVKKWEGPFDARTEYHGACAQAHIVHKQGIYGSEDCLHINVYTPHLPKNENEHLKSVIVWIHGYAFTSSLSHIHGADFLIDNDVLTITLTHRLGVFGFLKSNDTDTHANMGLKDIAMALKWIRKNIKYFGGNRENITVMGCGSAATLLSLLWTTKSRKLFSKMILQSGSLFSASIFQGNHKLESIKLKELLKEKGVTDLMKASTKDILAASLKIYNSLEIINKQRPLVQFSPIIEEKSSKSLLTKKPQDFFNDIQKVNVNIPILMGFNSQESISEVTPFLHNPHLLKSFAAFFKFLVPFSDGCNFNYTTNIYLKIAEKIKSRYFKSGFLEKPVNNFLWYTADLLKYPVYRFIKKYLSVHSNELFVYKFNFLGRFNAMKGTAVAGIDVKVKGASTGDEICYLLKCEPLWQSYVHINNDAYNRNRMFIKEISELWANFAKTGNPTPPSCRLNVTWSSMTSKNDNVLYLSNFKKLINSQAEEDMYKFWNDIYENFYSHEHCRESMRNEL